MLNTSTVPAKTDQGLPSLTETGGAGRTCPKCGHDFEDSAVDDPARLHTVLRLKPRRARCQHVIEDDGGWSTGVVCGCKATFHGS